MRSLRSILVPLDGSPFAEQALPLAVALGGVAKAKVRLALVHRRPSAPRSPEAAKLYTKIELATRRAERDYLADVAGRLKQRGCPDVTRATLTGPPGPVLVGHAAEWGASLVVMSTHGRGPLRRAWLGSVADYLVRHLAVPVLLVRPREDEAPLEDIDLAGRILVPLDGSRAGEAALDPAAKIAGLVGAELGLVQVVRPVAAAVVGGGVAGTILELAGGDEVTLVALATRGHGGLRRLTLGSVADKVVRGADRPVLVCPVKGRGR